MEQESFYGIMLDQLRGLKTDISDLRKDLNQSLVSSVAELKSDFRRDHDEFNKALAVLRTEFTRDREERDRMTEKRLEEFKVEYDSRLSKVEASLDKVKEKVLVASGFAAAIGAGLTYGFIHFT